MAYELDEEAARRRIRAKKIRTAVAVAIAAACAAGVAWVRFGMKKSGLGGPCTYTVQCGPDAPTCLRPSEDEAGVCSRPCEPNAPCADGIACVKVELDERDERGRRLEGGYCVPQAIADARKKKKNAPAHDVRDSWVDLPNVPGQIEGEIELRWEAPRARTATYVVRGTVSAIAAPDRAVRYVSEASALRTYFVDDKAKTFVPKAVEKKGREEDVTITKTAIRDRVAERDCEVWRIDEPKISRSVCVMLGGAFLDPQNTIAPAWTRELAARGAFPLRVIEHEGGRDRIAVAATRVDLRPVDAALLSVPKSYRNLAAQH